MVGHQFFGGADDQYGTRDYLTTQDIIPVDRPAHEMTIENNDTPVPPLAPFAEALSPSLVDKKPNIPNTIVSDPSLRSVRENAVAGPSTPRPSFKRTRETTTPDDSDADDITIIEPPTKKAKVEIIDLTKDDDDCCNCNCKANSGR